MKGPFALLAIFSFLANLLTLSPTLPYSVAYPFPEETHLVSADFILGAPYGSTAIDARFYELMQRRFGRGFTNLKPEENGPGSPLMEEFQTVKSQFSPFTADARIKCRMRLVKPNPLHYDRGERRIILSSNDLRQELFDPVVDNILRLIGNQLIAASQKGFPINKIVLVGGFGGSLYLQDKVRRSFSSQDLMVPPSPELAVAHGAALRGLRGPFTITPRLPRSYGIEVTYESRNGIDPCKETFLEPVGNRRMVREVSWVVRMGQEYPADYRHRQPTTIVHSANDPWRKFIRIFSCNLPTLLSRVDDRSLEVVNLLEVDFSLVPPLEFPQRQVNQERKYLLEAEIEFTFSAMPDQMNFAALVQERKLGVVTFRIPLHHT